MKNKRFALVEADVEVEEGRIFKGGPVKIVLVSLLAYFLLCFLSARLFYSLFLPKELLPTLSAQPGQGNFGRFGRM
jgi:hypothetical protein